MNSTLIPAGWKKITLGEFMAFKNGINADKSAYGHGTKFVNVMEIFRNNFLSKNEIRGSVRITDKQLSEYSVIRGDILFNRTSETRDEIAYSTVYTDNEAVTFGGFVIRGRQKKNLLLPVFAGYCFKNEKTRKEMIRRSQGAVRANIGQKDLNKIPILVPPKNEQKAIASLLETWDTAIEKTEALITVKQKRFEWLSTKMINQIEHRQYTKKVQLGTILRYVQPAKYIVKSTEYANNGRIPVLTANQSFILGYTDEREGIFDKLPVIIFDDFTTSSKFVNFPFKVKSSAMKILLPASNKINLDYVFVSMQRIKIPLGGHKRYWISEFQFFDIPLPPLQEQQRIAHTLNTTQSEITLLKQIAEQYRTQKRGLIQKLLTGKLKINI